MSVETMLQCSRGVEPIIGAGGELTLNIKGRTVTCTMAPDRMDISIVNKIMMLHLCADDLCVFGEFDAFV